MLLRKLKLEYLLEDKKDLINVFETQIFNSQLYIIDCIRDFKIVRFLITEEERILEIDIDDSRVFLNKKTINIFLDYWKESVISELNKYQGLNITELNTRTETIMHMFCFYLNKRFGMDLFKFHWLAIPNSLLKNSIDNGDSGY